MRALMMSPRLVLLFLVLAAPARADRLPLVPSSSTVGIRLYGLGLLPIDGKFTRFHGVLDYDPADHGHCGVGLQVEVASLVMASDSVRDGVIGPDFMDASRFPTLGFRGACDNRGVQGLLDMHGVTGALSLSLDWDRARVVATGRLRRADWRMTARPLIGGSTVRIQVAVALPDHPADGASR